MNTDKDNKKNGNLPISNVIKSLDDFITKEMYILDKFISDNSWKSNFPIDNDDKKIIELRGRIKALKDFRNSL